MVVGSATAGGGPCPCPWPAPLFVLGGAPCVPAAGMAGAVVLLTVLILFLSISVTLGRVEKEGRYNHTHQYNKASLILGILEQ